MGNLALPYITLIERNNSLKNFIVVTTLVYYTYACADLTSYSKCRILADEVKDR
jgi:hypothetical protein